MLELAGLAKVFGGVRAVDGVSLRVPPGAVFGLIGPNGSGKTTTVNLISGLYAPSGGSIRFEGREIGGAAPHRIAGLGIARTFQNMRLFGEMSVIDNVIAFQSGGIAGIAGWVRPRLAAAERARRERAEAILARLGLAELRHELAGRLSLGDQKRLEIARALALQPRLLLLDEPAGGMSLGEVTRLKSLLGALVAEGMTILLIEHNMKFVMEVSTDMAVLNFGKLIARGTPPEIRANPLVIEAYLGRS